MELKVIQDIIQNGCKKGQPYPWCEKGESCEGKACWYHEADEILKLIEQEYEPVQLEPLTDEEIKNVIRKYGAEIRKVAYDDNWFIHNMPELMQITQATIAKNQKEQLYRRKKRGGSISSPSPRENLADEA